MIETFLLIFFVCVLSCVCVCARSGFGLRRGSSFPATVFELHHHLFRFYGFHALVTCQANGSNDALHVSPFLYNLSS